MAHITTLTSSAPSNAFWDRVRVTDADSSLR
jgi:hypothetical protein